MRSWPISLALTAAVTLLCHQPLQAQGKDPYLLKREEIDQHQDIKTAYDLVQRLRPRFLRATRASAGYGSTSTTPSMSTSDDPSGGSSRSDGILVVVNSVRRGGVTELRQIDAGAVQSIRYIKGPDAVGVYGYEQAGVIEVVLVMGTQKPD